MKLKGVMAITGYHGLFKVVSQAKNNIIVESLIDGKRMPVFNSYKISSLEDIAVFTDDKELSLSEIFKIMLEKFEKKPSIDVKSSNNELIKAFSEVVPNYDKNRVYVSDIKKVFSWYNMLLAKDMLKEEIETKEEVTSTETEKTDVEKKITKVAKTTKTVKPKGTKTVKATNKSKSQTKTSVVRKSSSSSSSK